MRPPGCGVRSGADGPGRRAASHDPSGRERLASSRAAENGSKACRAWLPAAKSSSGAMKAAEEAPTNHRHRTAGLFRNVGMVPKIANWKTAAMQMEPKGWDGRPAQPERSGWHWVRTGDALRPLLWCGDDWPELLDRGKWRDGRKMLTHSDLCDSRYYGPVVTPPGVAASFRLKLLLGFDPTSKPRDTG